MVISRGDDREFDLQGNMSAAGLTRLSMNGGIA